MKNKFKNIVSLLLSFCMITSICSLSFAGQDDSSELENAIKSAKSILNIPSEYSEFEYSSEKNNYNGKDYTIWYLSWSTKDGDKRINAGIDENGDLNQYYKYSSDNLSSISNISKEQAELTSEKFLKKAFKSFSPEMKKVKISSSGNSSNFNFVYQQYVNDIPIAYNIINIGVNKFTGEVENFSGLNPVLKNLEYPEIGKVISIEEAEKAYIDKSGLSLKYYSYFDYKNKTLNVFPAYTLENFNTFVNAENGEIINDMEGYDSVNLARSTEDAKADGVAEFNELSEKEIEGIKNVNELITKEEAEKIIKKYVDVLPKDASITRANLTSSLINKDRFIWNISFDSANAQINAKTGQLISFNYYDYSEKYDDTKNKISEDEAFQKIESFLKNIEPKLFEQVKYKKTNNIKSYTNQYTFNFVRQVNNIDFVENGFNVTVTYDGRIVSYQNNFYENINFPDISKMVSSQEIFNKFKEYEKFDLEYILNSSNKPVLVYGFINMSPNYMLNYNNFEKVDIRGRKYIENEELSYKDIKGHWCEEIVKRLADSGYYLEGENFYPDQNITQFNFFKYITPNSARWASDEEEFYKEIIAKGYLKENEKDPNAFVTRQEACKYITRYLGYEKLAKNRDVFKDIFKDADKEYKAYITICYGLGIIKGSENNSFNGEENLTNAETAVILQNTLNIM